MPVAATSEPITTRRAGRPRDPGADGAILRATLDLVAEVGLSGLTVDAVAARAGVGKATIYRRWPSKEALLFVAVATLSEEPPVPDTGSVRGDLMELFAGMIDRFADERSGRLVVEMAAAAAQDPALLELQREFVDRRRRSGRGILRRAVARGELGPDVDVDLVLDLIVGPAAYRCFLSHQPITPDLLVRALDLVLAGLAGTAPEVDRSPGPG